MTELERWNHFKASVLVPSIKNNNWYPINSSIQLVQYIPTMEKLFSNAVNSYKMKSYQQAWSKFMKVATYIMEELRQHPQWKTLSSDLKGRLMNVLAKRSISYAEVSEAHMRAEFIQDVRRKDTEERERNQRIKRDIVAAACKEEKQTASKKEGEITFRTAITMFVNGEKVNVPTDINPHMRLVDFLRNLGKTGTKIGCGEGGCGACSVLMSFNNGTPETIPTHRVINSCLRSIASCDGAYITTVEGIGASGRNKKMHPVQERLAQCNGSQCGYCSPGWVMNAYSMLMNNPTPSSKQVVQDRFDGNLCRCTGMRSILQAFSSFVPSDDGDKKDKGDYSKTCCSSSDNKSKASQTLATYDPQSQIQLANKLLPSVLSRENMMLPLKLSCTNISNTKKEQEKETTVPTWYAPTSLSNFNSILTEVIEAKQTYQLELGGTSRGVTKYYNGQVDGTSSGDVEPDVYISIFRVEELNAIATDSNNNLIFGASVTLSEVIVALRKSTGDPMHQQLANHLSRVANLQVRNVGGWAGNLMLAKMYPTFPSDILTTMSAAGAILTFQRWTISEADENDNDCDDTTVLQQPKVEHLSVPSWAYESPSTDYKDVLLNISIPPSTAPSTTVPRTVFTSYKLARRQQNSHALVNFACRLLLDPADDKTVLSATIYLHGNDNQRLTHAVSTCNALIGQDITSQSTLISALNALETTDLKNRAPFVISASSSLLYKTILTAQPNEISPALVTATNWQLPRGISTGTEVWSPPDPTKEKPPAGTGSTKALASLQCTGQANYVSDFSAANSAVLHAAPIQSTSALAVVSGIDSEVALSMNGVVAVITADDIDTTIGMINDCGVEAIDNSGNASPEQIFVPINGMVETIGQTIGLVVASSREEAQKAAAAMMDPSTGGIAYTKSKDEPILNLDDAIAKGSFYKGVHTAVLERLAPNVASIEDAMSSCEHSWKGTVRMSGQRHFYMETQRSTVTPTENEGLHVRSSTQGPTVVAKYVAKVCGVPTHNVECEMLRCGGAFGGKLTRNLPIACAAAVACKKLNAPVEYVLDRVEDERATGGREAMRMDIEVGFDSEGNVDAFKVCLFIDAGWTIDGSFGDLDMATNWSDNAYYIPNFHCESKACRTNTPTCTSMRAPGVLHSINAIETAMDHVAATLKMDPNVVRFNNFYQVGNITPYNQTLKYVSLQTCWNQVLAKYTSLQKECDTFNDNNRWVKRSVAMTPAKYGIQWSGTFSGSNVSIYGRDGSIIISHGGCEIGQGLFTKVMQAAATALGLDDPKDFDLIRTGPTSNVMVPNNSMTGGSSTSEVTCQSVMNACATLVARLKPYRDPVSSGGKGLAWRDAVAAAYNDHVQLSAKGWFAPKGVGGDKFRYFVYGSALSMVELDVLTGQSQILRTDIVYDCGNSINPIIDIGQIEGGFVMGVGTWLTEEVTFDSTGKLTSNGTWDYKPPCTKDIPLEFNVTLLKNNPNIVGILGSKATAEPPMILSNSVHFALRRTIELARLDRGLSPTDAGTFVLNTPATAERVLDIIGTVPNKDFVLKM